MRIEVETEALQQRELRVIRSENPLFSTLPQDRLHFARFRDIVNRQLSEQNANPVGVPRIERVSTPPFGYKNYTLIDIPFNRYSVTIEESLKNLVASVGSSGEVGDEDEENLAQGHTGRRKDLYVFSTSLYLDNDSPYANKGILVRGRGKNLERTGAGTVIINNGGGSEAILAYETVVAALIVQGRLDLSTRDAVSNSIPFRRKIFMDIYTEMVAEKEPFVRREEIFDLDEQIDDIETDLYRPLKMRDGKPMNTLLVGAAGVGKSIVGRFFMGDKEVLTLPVSIDKLQTFERGWLPKITRVKSMIDTPAVLLVDDVEALLGSSFSIDEQGKKNQVIDPEDRSDALSRLERMQDTYGIYLLCTLNNPDVEAAFLRRFNPIYFPLPTEDQRRFMLRKIVPQGNLSDQSFTTLIDGFSKHSDGFNYHGLARITEHFENIELKSATDSEEKYIDALKQAFRRASRIINKKALARMDAAARAMVGLAESS